MCITFHSNAMVGASVSRDKTTEYVATSDILYTRLLFRRGWSWILLLHSITPGPLYIRRARCVHLMWHTLHDPRAAWLWTANRGRVNDWKMSHECIGGNNSDSFEKFALFVDIASKTQSRRILLLQNILKRRQRKYMKVYGTPYRPIKGL